MGGGGFKVKISLYRGLLKKGDLAKFSVSEGVVFDTCLHYGDLHTFEKYWLWKKIKLTEN